MQENEQVARPAGESAPVVLECRDLGKRFGSSVALAQVDLKIHAGEVHGLVGCNGAGKSTWMKIFAGAFADYDGQVLIDGAPVHIPTPAEARRLGIAMVYQELSGIGQLSVAENLFLGRPLPNGYKRWIPWTLLRRQAENELAELGLQINVRKRLDSYPLVIRQMVEIARGLHSGARVLILDEPTSALSPPEAKRLFDWVARMKMRGIAFVFISHFLEDVLSLCDRVTVLRDGRKVATHDSCHIDKRRLIQEMLGRDLAESSAMEVRALPEGSSAPILLQTKKLALDNTFAPLNLIVRQGEVVGLYGYVGAGHQELTHVLAGAIAPTAGSVEIAGRPLPPGDVAAAIAEGVVLVAADREKTLFKKAEIFKNLSIARLKQVAGGWITRRREIQSTMATLKAVGCRPAKPNLLAGRLSGGNQQKIVLGKWLLGDIRVLLLEEPTRGMDVAAKEEVMRLVADLRREGVGVVLASTEHELLLAHADRILVFRRGEVAAELAGQTVDKEALLSHA